MHSGKPDQPFPAGDCGGRRDRDLPAEGRGCGARTRLAKILWKKGFSYFAAFWPLLSAFGLRVFYCEWWLLLCIFSCMSYCFLYEATERERQSVLFIVVGVFFFTSYLPPSYKRGCGMWVAWRLIGG